MQRRDIGVVMADVRESYYTQFRQRGEVAVRRDLETGRLGDDKAAYARAWLAQLDRDRKAEAAASQDEALRAQVAAAEASNRIASEANDIARQARDKAQAANNIAIAAIAIAALGTIIMAILAIVQASRS